MGGMAQTCLMVDMSPPWVCERGPSPSGLDNIFGSLRMGALVRASVPLPSRLQRCPGRRTAGCGQPCLCSPFQPQDRRGPSTGILRPRKNPRSEMQGVIAGDPKAWVLPLKPPSSPSSGGTSQKLTQEGGAPAHTGARGPQAQALLKEEPTVGRMGQRPMKSPQLMVPAEH